jgi:hypothetical protein
VSSVDGKTGAVTFSSPNGTVALGGSGNNITFEAVASAPGTVLYDVLVTTALIAKAPTATGTTPAGFVAPLIAFDAGLTVGHKYALTLSIINLSNTFTASQGQGLSNAKWSQGLYVTNSATGSEDSIDSLVGFAQLNTANPPEALQNDVTNAISGGTEINPNTKIVSNAWFNCVYTATTSSIYVNLAIEANTGNGYDMSYLGWTATAPQAYTLTWTATDLGA